jgi:tagaturonate epimerase
LVSAEAPRPQLLGLRPSVGLGDRIGLATPGHVRALRSTSSRLAPIFAQQSIREMERTARTPGDVMDDATRGLLEAGWEGPFGADADHLKTTEHIDRCLPHGYTFFTIDPSDHVGAPVPWERLEDTPRDLVARLARPLDLGDRALEPTAEELRGAAATYGAAVAHVAGLYRHLRDRAPAGSFELEVSVDETDAPTTHASHVYIADALTRLGVRWVSLAPRFVGSFEKGIDYIGEVHALAEDLAVHAAIARRLGPYKLSVHSGSDKFSAYPAIAEATAGVLHLKTAGTSYLEALRAVALYDEALMARIYAFALERFATDRATYHLSAGPPDPGARPDLDDPAVRQVLHVTFGSVLTSELGDELRSRLGADLREPYAEALEQHLGRHLAPFG